MVQAYPKGHVEEAIPPDAIESPEWVVETFLDDIKGSPLEKLFKKALENRDSNLFIGNVVTRKELEAVIYRTGAAGYTSFLQTNMQSRLCRYEGNFFNICIGTDFSTISNLINHERSMELSEKAKKELKILE